MTSTCLPTVTELTSVLAGFRTAQVRTAASGDLLYILDRAKLHVNAQGFITRGNLAEHVRRGQVWIIDVNGEAAGYVFASGGLRRPMVLRHNTVEEELWSQGLGRAFTEWWLRFAAEHTPFRQVYIRTRRDLVRQISINRAVGAKVVSTVNHIGCRGHAVDIWSASLRSQFEFPPAAVPHGSVPCLRKRSQVIGLFRLPRRRAQLRLGSADATHETSRNAATHITDYTTFHPPEATTTTRVEHGERLPLPPFREANPTHAPCTDSTNNAQPPNSVDAAESLRRNTLRQRTTAQTQTDEIATP